MSTFAAVEVRGLDHQRTKERLELDDGSTFDREALALGHVDQPLLQDLEQVSDQEQPDAKNNGANLDIQLSPSFNQLIGICEHRFR
jgi:hypothetical protein